MKQGLDSYTEYEKRFKVEVYRLAFTLCTLICSIYCYFNFIRGNMLDTSANGAVVVLSVIGLLLLKRKITSRGFIGSQQLVIFSFISVLL